MTINRTHHDLKIDQQPFADLLSGGKTCEIRKDDRGFNVGDTVRLHEREDADYTGRTLDRAITHIQRGYGLPDGLCVLSYAWAAPEAEPVAYAQAWDDAPQHERIVAALTAPPATGVIVQTELLRRLEWAIADMDDYNPELLELRALLAQSQEVKP